MLVKGNDVCNTNEENFKRGNNTTLGRISLPQFLSKCVIMDTGVSMEFLVDNIIDFINSKEIVEWEGEIVSIL